MYFFIVVDMVWGSLPCRRSGSLGSRSCGRGSNSNSQSYTLVDKADEPLDDNTLSALLGDDVYPVAQANGDATR